MQKSGKGDKGDFVVRLSSGTRDVSIGYSETTQTSYDAAPSEEANVTIDFFDATNGSHVGHEVAIAQADAPTVEVAHLQAAVLTAIAAVPAQRPSSVTEN